MSLKAKIEAVIYAAEEPVTLPQIASLFQAELLEERQTRLKAEASMQGELEAESRSVVEPVMEFEETPEQADPSAEKPSEGTALGSAESPAEDERAAARQRDRETREEARRIIAQLIEEHNGAARGIEIREIAGGYRVATKPEYHDVVRGFIKSLKPPMKLSLQALETLAVIAYKQPVTAPEVSEIRGVDSAGVLGSLLSRKLIATAGRKQVIGRPILYKTTKEFLLRFGLKDLNELPSIEEFEKMAGELAETEDAVSAKDLPFEEQTATGDNGTSVPTEEGSEPEQADEGTE